MHSTVAQPEFLFPIPYLPALLPLHLVAALLPFLKLTIRVNLPYLGDTTKYQISIQLRLKFCERDHYYQISRDPSYPAPEHDLTVVTTSGPSTVIQSATPTQVSQSSTS